MFCLAYFHFAFETYSAHASLSLTRSSLAPMNLSIAANAHDCECVLSLRAASCTGLLPIRRIRFFDLSCALRVLKQILPTFIKTRLDVFGRAYF